MKDKTIDLNAQAGSGIRAILDISGDLKVIRSNLNDLM